MHHDPPRRRSTGVSNTVVRASDGGMLMQALTTTNHHLIDLALQGIANDHTRRAYTRELRRFFGSEPEALDRQAVLRYRTRMVEEGRSTASINMAINAIRKLALEAHERGALAESAFAGIHRVGLLAKKPRRTGIWHDIGDVEEMLLRAPATNRGRRDRAAVAVMVLCGLRRAEIANLQCHQFQNRNGRWVIADVLGKGDKVRTVGMTEQCWEIVYEWVEGREGWFFPAIKNPDRVTSDQTSGEVVYKACKRYGVRPHDLRRTCAMLADNGGASVEEISLQLGHQNAATTALYMRANKAMKNTAADKIVLAIGNRVV